MASRLSGPTLPPRLLDEFIVGIAGSIRGESVSQQATPGVLSVSSHARDGILIDATLCSQSRAFLVFLFFFFSSAAEDSR